jgi:hypothetical protein
MSKGYSISPLRPEDLAELSQFLVQGFGLPADVGCLSVEALRWKYLKAPSSAGPTSLIARSDGRIVGHAGFCPRTFVLRAESSREIATTHPIDWLASPEHPSVGLLLLLRGFGASPTQYCIGGNPVAQKMFEALGFECRSHIPLYHKVLRPLHRRLASTQGPIRKYLGAARDLAIGWRRTPAPRRPVELSRVTAFGPAAAEVVSSTSGPLLFSTRTPALLDDYLSYPNGCISGWTIHEDGRMIGLALLCVVREGEIRHGRLVECFLNTTDAALWQSAMAALTAVLEEQSADDVTCFASTPWMERALRETGFRRAGSVEFLLRDGGKLLPPDIPWHITQLEADHAYLQ